MSKMVESKKLLQHTQRVSVIDPQARLDAWERARGALTKPRMKKILRQLHLARKEWERPER